jgi:hypothetical protein
LGSRTRLAGRPNVRGPWPLPAASARVRVAAPVVGGRVPRARALLPPRRGAVVHARNEPVRLRSRASTPTRPSSSTSTAR